MNNIRYNAVKSNRMKKNKRMRFGMMKEDNLGKVIVIVHSYHHGNTEKVAKSIAGVLNAEVRKPQNVTPEELGDYSLVGLGSGIDSSRHYKPILDFAEKLHPVDGQKVFIFSTAGTASKKSKLTNHTELRKILVSKGYEVIGEFDCKGYDTFGILKYIGGINRSRPSNMDLANAKDFAREMKQALLTTEQTKS